MTEGGDVDADGAAVALLGTADGSTGGLDSFDLIVTMVTPAPMTSVAAITPGTRCRITTAGANAR